MDEVLSSTMKYYFVILFYMSGAFLFESQLDWFALLPLGLTVHFLPLLFDVHDWRRTVQEICLALLPKVVHHPASRWQHYPLTITPTWLYNIGYIQVSLGLGTVKMKVLPPPPKKWWPWPCFQGQQIPFIRVGSVWICMVLYWFTVYHFTATEVLSADLSNLHSQ